MAHGTAVQAPSEGWTLTGVRCGPLFLNPPLGYVGVARDSEHERGSNPTATNARTPARSCAVLNGLSSNGLARVQRMKKRQEIMHFMRVIGRLCGIEWAHLRLIRAVLSLRPGPPGWVGQFLKVFLEPVGRFLISNIKSLVWGISGIYRIRIRPSVSRELTQSRLRRRLRAARALLSMNPEHWARMGNWGAFRLIRISNCGSR